MKATFLMYLILSPAEENKHTPPSISQLQIVSNSKSLDWWSDDIIGNHLDEADLNVLHWCSQSWVECISLIMYIHCTSYCPCPSALQTTICLPFTVYSLFNLYSYIMLLDENIQNVEKFICKMLIDCVTLVFQHNVRFPILSVWFENCFALLALNGWEV